MTGLEELGCRVGVFLGNAPAPSGIRRFCHDYGKAPAIVMVFVDWQRLPEPGVLSAIRSQGAIPLMTWEPWYADKQEGEPVDYARLLKGGYDAYLSKVAERLIQTAGEVLIRPAHEMNGFWYPWSGVHIGAKGYIALYRYLRERLDRAGARNARWVFSVNADDQPSKEDNHCLRYYPGDAYVDYIGLDGYNWGNTRPPWSRWKSFSEIFESRYDEMCRSCRKPVLITEFSSTSQGSPEADGKAGWIREAMRAMKRMSDVKGFVLFNFDKETDWGFPIDTPWGRQFKALLEDPYFRGAS